MQEAKSTLLDLQSNTHLNESVECDMEIRL